MDLVGFSSFFFFLFSNHLSSSGLTSLTGLSDITPLERVRYSTSPPKYVEPIKLHELTSDRVYEDYGANVFRDLPRPSQKSREKQSKARRSKRLPNSSLQSERSSDSDELENERQRLLYDGMMRTFHPDLTMSVHDIELIGQIQKPSKSLSLAAAATLIVLTENGEIPQNISWESFRGEILEPTFPSRMNSLKPANVPQVM
jgi:hypothetical protein